MGRGAEVIPRVSESGAARDHNPCGYTMWMAVGEVMGGLAYGATDEFGFKRRKIASRLTAFALPCWPCSAWIVPRWSIVAPAAISD